MDRLSTTSTFVTEEFNSISYNPENKAFVCGSEDGFKIIDLETLNQKAYKKFNGSIDLVEMHPLSPIVAFVGGLNNKKYPVFKVIFWDIKTETMFDELEFRSSVKQIKFNHAQIFVVLEYQIYIYNTKDFRLIKILSTSSNPKGVMATNHYNHGNVLAYPDRTAGKLKVIHFDKKDETVIEAHKSNLGNLALDPKGARVASASIKGTLIRVWNVKTGEMIQEVRRGIISADIGCIAFDLSSKWIGCTSSRGTVHIFEAAQTQEETRRSTNATEVEDIIPVKRSFWDYLLKNVFNSERSIAQYPIEEQKALCLFPHDNHVIIFSNSGVYYHIAFNPLQGKDCDLVAKRTIHVRDSAFFDM